MKSEGSGIKSSTSIILIVVFLSFLSIASFSLGRRATECTNGNHLWLQDSVYQEKQIPDRIRVGDIIITTTQLVLSGKYNLVEYKNTDSMLPLLDYGSTGIQIKVTEETELVIGDVVSYRIEDSESRVVHRIIDAGIDSQGVYYITKGDNVNEADSVRVRRSQIEKVLVGVLW